MAKSRPVCARMRSVSPLTFSWGSSITPRFGVAHDTGVGCPVAAGALATRGEGLVTIDLDERCRICADDVYLAPLSRAVTPEREAPYIRMRRIRLGKLKPIVQWDYVGTYAIHQPQVDDSCASNDVVDNVRIPDLTVAVDRKSVV